MSSPIEISPLAARRFMRRALGFDSPFPDLASALDHHGFIQIDPINVCGRMHDLILRNRVRDYREGALHEFLHSPTRPGFEHYLPGQGILVAFPQSAWPFLTGAMERRMFTRNLHSGRFTPREAQLAKRILAELEARGPLTSDDLSHEGRARSAWGTPGSLTKRVLEKLFAHGRVLITARQNFRRVYDLPPRVLPPDVLATPPRPEPEVRRWLVLTKLRQRRLVLLKRDELPLVAEMVQPVKISGADCPTLHCLRDDLRHLDSPTANDSAAPDQLRLVAPLDPIIYDRRVTRGVWGFDYTWEVYTPPAKRTRGYYALPVLAGTEIAGHIDPKADRERNRLVVMSRRVRRGVRTADAVAGLAQFLGLKQPAATAGRQSTS